MNLYSSKQRWKIALLVIAIFMVIVSLYISNQIVKSVSEQERYKAKQWADAIKKKIELVQLTNSTFDQVRNLERNKIKIWIDASKELTKETPLDVIPDYTFPLHVIGLNKDIPVIVLDDEAQLSSYINLDFTEDLFKTDSTLTNKEITSLFEDSVKELANYWKKNQRFFRVEAMKGFFLNYYYDDSKGLKKLEKDRDELINTFNKELITNKSAIPVLLLDSISKEIIGTNIRLIKEHPYTLDSIIKQLSKINQPIQIDFNNGKKYTLYFDESPALKQLRYYPYIQFIMIGLIGLIGYIIFSTFRKAEQNQVWAGMAKETAHQLGTPISSLMAWTELLESYAIDPMIPKEMSKDITRLTKVTERFSKIGSVTKLDNQDISTTVKSVLDYLSARFSNKITLTFEAEENLKVNHNGPLMEWVIENICKNAVDAMSGKGKLSVKLHQTPEWVHIDITDTGKGMLPKEMKNVFKPGYTTKTRGWGLGLSLVKRIITEFHKGKVFVLESEVGKGTTFRISLKQ